MPTGIRGGLVQFLTLFKHNYLEGLKHALFENRVKNAF